MNRRAGGDYIEPCWKEVGFNSWSHGKPLQGRDRHTQEGKEGGREEGWISGTLLTSTPSYIAPVPAHSDAGEVHGRHRQWHGVSEYQEIHTPRPGCQELHVSAKPSIATLTPTPPSPPQESCIPPSRREEGSRHTYPSGRPELSTGIGSSARGLEKTSWRRGAWN